MRPPNWRIATNTSISLVPPPLRRGEPQREEGVERVTILCGDEEREPTMVVMLRDRVEGRRHVVTMSATSLEEARDVFTEALSALDTLLREQKERG